MSFDHRPIRHRSIVTPIEFDSSSTGNFHDPLINTAITPNCTNDEEIARQHQEQLYAPSLMNTSQPPRAPSIDMRTLEELEADEALARKLQEEEYTRKSIVPNRSYPRGSSNNHRAAPISTINRSRIIQTDAELAAQLQEEEDRKQRQQRLVPPANLNFRRFQNPTNNHSNAPEIVPIPPFNQLRPQSGRRDSSDDSDNDNQPAVRSTRNRPNHLPANRNNNNTIRSQDIFSLFQPIFAGVNRGRHRHLEQMSDDFGPDDYENLLELDKSIEHKPLTSEQINRLPTEKFRRTHAKTTEESTCNICWDEFENDQITRRLPCLHNYHKDCIDKWLKTNNTCPICRIAANQ